MKVAVVTFPGSNCDEDAAYVAESLLGASTTRVWHKDASLPDGTDLVILPGGFSYGDALRSGALARFSPVMGAVRSFAERGGLVLGICNGFQILLEAGLLPGAMLQNASQKFVCKRVRLRAHDTGSPFMRGLAGRVLEMPVAHHEGRYHASDEVLDRLFEERRVAFTYEGANPNGAARDIAGVLSEKKNVLGLMPHPERAVEAVLGGEDGLGMFLAAKSFLEAR